MNALLALALLATSTPAEATDLTYYGTIQAGSMDVDHVHVTPFDQKLVTASPWSLYRQGLWTNNLSWSASVYGGEVLAIGAADDLPGYFSVQPYVTDYAMVRWHHGERSFSGWFPVPSEDVVDLEVVYDSFSVSGRGTIEILTIELITTDSVMRTVSNYVWPYDSFGGLETFSIPPGALSAEHDGSELHIAYEDRIETYRASDMAFVEATPLPDLVTEVSSVELDNGVVAISGTRVEWDYVCTPSSSIMVAPWCYWTAVERPLTVVGNVGEAASTFAEVDAEYHDMAFYDFNGSPYYATLFGATYDADGNSIIERTLVHR